MKKKQVRALALLLALVMLLAACGGTSPSGGKDTSAPPADTAKDPIRIGVTNPLSGNLAFSGNDSLVGTLVAIDMFNERGGVNGRMVEAVIADVPDPATAQTETNRLIQQEKYR